MKLRNKFLLILLLIILLFFIYENKIFANTDYNVVDDIIISIPDLPSLVLSDYPYYILQYKEPVSSSSYEIHLIASQSPIILDSSGTYGYNFYNQPFIQYTFGSDDRVTHPRCFFA